jgi:hypothetical protein
MSPDQRYFTDSNTPTVCVIALFAHLHGKIHRPVSTFFQFIVISVISDLGQDAVVTLIVARIVQQGADANQ